MRGVFSLHVCGLHPHLQLKISLPEMERWVRGRGAIGDYLYALYTHNPIYEQRGIVDTSWRTWIVWDMINIAWLLKPEWVPSDLRPSPVLDDSWLWQHPPNRHLMREAYDVNRDAIFRDFYLKLDEAA